MASSMTHTTWRHEAGRHPRARPPSSSPVGREGDKKTVIDGPFAETKELVAGFWIWQVRNRDEALEWLKRAPFREGEVELRQIFEAEDFGAELTPELREAEERIRQQAAQQQRR